MKRPAKVKMQLVAAAKVSHLTFSDALGGRKSVYKDILVQACQSGQAIEITDGDSYALIQFKVTAKKLKLRLLYAKSEGSLYIKAVRIEGEVHRLFLLLREPRSVAELEGKKLELDLRTTLSEQTNTGLVKAVVGKDKTERYVLTEAGLKAMVQ